MKKAKPWSKARREHHKRRCQEAGQLRKSMNFVYYVEERAKEIGINAHQLMILFYHLHQNEKLPLDDAQNDTVFALLKKKMVAVQVYEKMFGSLRCQS